MSELDQLQKNHVMIMSGPDLDTLVTIQADGRDLDRDVHLLQRRFEAHQL